jgi:hypothetical protein
MHIGLHFYSTSGRVGIVACHRTVVALQFVKAYVLSHSEYDYTDMCLMLVLNHRIETMKSH